MRTYLLGLASIFLIIACGQKQSSLEDNPVVSNIRQITADSLTFELRMDIDWLSVPEVKRADEVLVGITVYNYDDSIMTSIGGYMQKANMIATTETSRFRIRFIDFQHIKHSELYTLRIAFFDPSQEKELYALAGKIALEIPHIHDINQKKTQTNGTFLYSSDHHFLATTGTIHAYEPIYTMGICVATASGDIVYERNGLPSLMLNNAQSTNVDSDRSREEVLQKLAQIESQYREQDKTSQMSDNSEFWPDSLLFLYKHSFDETVEFYDLNLPKGNHHLFASVWVYDKNTKDTTFLFTNEFIVYMPEVAEYTFSIFNVAVPKSLEYDVTMRVNPNMCNSDLFYSIDYLGRTIQKSTACKNCCTIENEKHVFKLYENPMFEVTLYDEDVFSLHDELDKLTLTGFGDTLSTKYFSCCMKKVD